jgi:hypothetical protein
MFRGRDGMIEITRHVRSVMYRERGRRHGFLAVFVAE